VVRRDEVFVTDHAAEAEKIAKALELSGNLCGGWQEYRRPANTVNGLGEYPVFRERAAALEKQKTVRDGAKRERQEFEEQSRLTADISWRLSARRESAILTDGRSEIVRQISELRGRAEREKNPQKLRVLRGALAGVFIEAMEAGDDRYQAKDFSHACTYFELAAAPAPDSAWALDEVAVARALDGDR
jgi:hypothetical protein